MRTSVPRPVVLFTLLFLFAAEHLTFLPAARAQATGGRQFLRGQVPAVVAGLQPIGRLAATNRLNLAIGLPLRNQQALAQLLQQLADPAHPNYRHYLTPEEFAARFGPTEQDYQAVITFAQANGLTVTGRHPNRTLLDVTGSVPDIEKALHVTMHVYQHPAEARTFYAPDAEPALDLAVPVLGISGLNNYALPRPRLHARPLGSGAGVSPVNVSKGVFAHTAGGTPAPLLVQPNAGSGPSGTYMGGDFRAAYLPGVALTGAGQSVGLLQFDGYTPSDITYYENQNGLPSVPLVNVLLDGFTGNPTGSGGEVEVSLDIEMAISMAPGLAGVMVYMAGPYGNFHDILNRMATDNLAKQLSCSWYLPGGGPDPVADQIFEQMAAQGQSFFNASGDYDAFTGPVDFPGETPYIVQVGGTTLTTSGPGGAWVSETVWNWNNGIGSGGGISTRYAIPSYQADISMTLNQGSTTMRNIPDVALTADNIYVRVDGGDWEGGGTSCAAPLWAGFMALVNQQAVASGRPVVGFINPAVDGIGHAGNYTACFHDITTGNNTSPSSPSRFYAVSGYDLCTGWGTPAGQSLITALANPDPLLISPSALAFSGGVGGPFSPNPGWLTLTNTGTNTLNWTLGSTSVWFDVSPTNGTLLPGGAAASVSVSVDASAGTFPAGVYAATLAFTNQTSGVTQSCALVLSVAASSMADDFDPGIDLSQWSSFGGVVGSTVLATNYGDSVSAPNSLWFGNAGSRYATTIPVNTSGGGQIGFCIRLANGLAWPWASVNNLPADGVVLESSTNGGGSWTALGNYNTSAYYNWTGVAMPIPAVAQAPATLFRWRQLSNSGANYEHWALDNVIVGTGSMAPKIVMDPQSQNVAVGDPASLSVAAVGTPPLSYQWLLNGTNIDGATASSLVWTNIQLTNAGTYSVLVSNNLGTVLSSNAVLTVYVPVCAPPSGGLVSWWPGEGNAHDTAGTNNGTLVGSVTFAVGEVGQAFSFNGTSAYVSIAAGSTLNVGAGGGLTIEAWIKPADLSVRPIVEWNSGGSVPGLMYWGVHLWASQGAPYGNGPGCLYANMVDSTGANHYFSSPGGLLSTNQFQHVALTYDKTSGLANIYLNGQVVAQQVVGVFTPQTAWNLYLGARVASPDGAHFYWAGQMDEISLYNRALSVTEIAAIYNAGSAGKCQTPAPPSIQTQPQSQVVAVGASANLSVVVAGTPPLSYQWRFNTTNIAAATGSVLTLANVQLTNAGSYDVVVTNLYGSTNSFAATLTVLFPPQITVQPQDQSVGVGSNATFTVTATGSDPLNYQWYFNGASLSTATNSSLVLDGVTFSQAGGYSVSVSNLVGSVTSRNAILVVQGNSTCAPPPAGLVSWWPGEGNAYDIVGGNSGVLTNGVTFALGMVGQAFSFNGTSSYVQIADSPNLHFTNAMTIEAWIYPTTLSGTHNIVSKWDWPGANSQTSYTTAVNPGGQLGFAVCGVGNCSSYPSVSSTNLIPANQWTHFAATYDGSYLRMYVNAVCQNQTAYSGGIFPGTNTLLIGAALASPGQILSPFAGQIDETAVYSRALSAAEIAAIYNAGSAGKCPTPAPPSIQTQPQSQVVAVGASASLSVIAAGTPPFSYQWRFNSTNIAAATGSVLTLANVQLTNAGSYDVVVTNLYGSTNSSPATLTVLIPPQITVQPQDQYVGVGSNVTFTVTATGSGPLNYQWYFNGAALAAATNSSLVLNGVTVSQAGSYSVSVSNLVGSVSSRNAILAVVGNGSCASPPAGIVSWWPGEGNAHDTAGTNNGTLVGSVTFAVGEVGQAFSFNGTSAYVSIAAGSTLNVGAGGGLTIEAWIKPADLSVRPIVEWNSGGSVPGLMYWGVHLWASQGAPYGNGPGCLYANMVDSTGANHYFSSPGGLLSTNQFQHVALTYDKTSGLANIYLNGQVVAQQVVGVFTPQTAWNLYLGARVASPDGAHFYWAGQMDEISLYNRALSVTEIAAIYNAGSAGKCALAPSILTPLQSQTIQLSSNATFSVTATGISPLAYQWFFGTNTISGATNTALLLTNAGFAQAGNYSVAITNAYGCATGGPAVLTVVDTIPPTIISCASNQTLSVGANCTATLPDLTGGVVAWDASGPVTVTQNPPPGTQMGLGMTNVAFTAQDSSGNASVCACSVTAVDTTPPFVLACVLQVTLGFDTNCQALLPDLTGTNYIIASDNCSAVSIAQAPPAQTAMAAGTNLVVLTVSDAFSNQTTRAVNVIVSGAPQISSQPTNLSAVLSRNAAFRVTACGSSPLSYQWQHAGTNLLAGTNAVLSLSNLQTNDAGDYQVVITNFTGSLTSAVATLTVLQPPVINSLSFNLTTFMLTVPTEAGSTYDLEYKDTLEDPSWKVLTSFWGTGWPIQLTDDGLTNATRFYRVRVR